MAVHIHTRVLQVCIQDSSPWDWQTISEIANVVVHTIRIHCLRDLRLDQFHELVDQLVLHAVLGTGLPLRLSSFLSHVGS